MVNPKNLKKGDMIKPDLDMPEYGMYADNAYVVVEAGFSRWDGYYYAEVETPVRMFEINPNNGKSFSAV